MGVSGRFTSAINAGRTSMRPRRRKLAHIAIPPASTGHAGAALTNVSEFRHVLPVVSATASPMCSGLQYGFRLYRLRAYRPSAPPAFRVPTVVTEMRVCQLTILNSNACRLSDDCPVWDKAGPMYQDLLGDLLLNQTPSSTNYPH